jgi:outer membrane protein assembly factor BamB
MKPSIPLSALVAVILSVPVLGAPQVAPGDWPWWRGPTCDGKSPDAAPVSSWDAQTNIVWKTAVPGRGHSSPIVCGGRVFLTTADERAQKQYVLAFDRTTGKPLWTTLAHEGGLPPMNPKNSQASATSAYDGSRVYSAFVHKSGLHVTATDLDGKILWQTKAGDFASEHGYGCSPVLYGSLVIVNGDSLKGSFLAALDGVTGKVAWKTPRPSTGRHGSYCTPVVAELARRPQLLMTGMGEVSAYDPATGKRLWFCTGPAEVTGCTPAFGESLVFVTGGFPEKQLLAIRADGSGDVSASHIVWRTGKGVAYVPSPLYDAGRLFVITDNGIATCFEAATGRQLWQDRLQGAFTSSPVLAGDLLYVTNEKGKTFVLRAGPKFEVVATNDLGAGVMATPALCGGQVFLRTSDHLYCLGRAAGARRK